MSNKYTLKMYFTPDNELQKFCMIVQLVSYGFYVLLTLLVPKIAIMLVLFTILLIVIHSIGYLLLRYLHSKQP